MICTFAPAMYSCINFSLYPAGSDCIWISRKSALLESTALTRFSVSDAEKEIGVSASCARKTFAILSDRQYINVLMQLILIWQIDYIIKLHKNEELPSSMEVLFGMPDRIRTCALQSRSYAVVHESSVFWQVFMYDVQNMAVYKTALNRCGAMVQSCFLCRRENSSQIVV